jgi:glycosyltransferase involved in cell wall biosynthesis
MMKVSIITVSYNCETTIEDTILSVAAQDYSRMEHIVIDGGSTDKTMEVVEKHGTLINQYISEPDNGIYDAMNKGIKLATGDVVGILNADDIYFDNSCISEVVNGFEEKGVSAICGNLVYVSPDNLNKVVRFYSSEGFLPNMFAFGMMPAHPTFFVLRNCYESFGLYKEDYKIAADFELLLRLLKIHRISYHCIPRTLVKMRRGGVSTRNIKSNWVLNKEILKACRENNIDTNMLKILSKYFTKLFQLIQRPS